jgi:hypothetical protein
MQKLQDNIDFSVSGLENYQQEGRNLNHLVQDQLTIDPIGLIQLNTNHGLHML